MGAAIKRKTSPRAKAVAASRRPAGKGSKPGLVWFIVAGVALILFFEAKSLFVKGIEAPNFIQVQSMGGFTGTGQDCGRFGAWDVTAMGNERIAVTDADNGRVLLFDRSGKFLKAFGKKGDGPLELKEPSGITADDSHVYFVDAWKSVLIGLDANAKQVMSIPLTQGFYGPRGVAWDGKAFYIADTGTHRVVKLLPSGDTAAVWGGKGQGDGKDQLNNPRSLKVDSKGNVYVADSENSRVQVIDPQGKFIRAIKVENKVSDVAVDSHDRIYVCSSEGNFVKVFNPEGKYIGTLKDGKGQENNLHAGSGIGFTPDGVLLITSSDSVSMYRVP